jgi:Cu+-exporting ATPase
VSDVKHPAVANASVEPANLAQIGFKVSGMTCEMCAVSVRTALLKLSGVAEAKVDVAGAAAYVRYDPDRVKPDQLIEAVNATGFKASL